MIVRQIMEAKQERPGAARQHQEDKASLYQAALELRNTLYEQKAQGADEQLAMALQAVRAVAP